MPNRPLIKGKPRYTKRRLITIFILCTILVAAIMTGFSSGLNSDNTIYTPDGDRIVMWQELPESGTPEDFDLLTDLRYSAQRLYTSKYFKGEAEGDVIANVGMGIKYTQHVHNIRVVKNGVIFSEAVSSSSLKNVADQRYINGDTVLIRPATVSGGNVTFGSGVNKITLADYYARYGARANELTKYQINNKTILAVKDENADVAVAPKSENAESSDDDVVEFDVPNALVKGNDGLYCFTLTLDPIESTKYYRNEVRTLASADQNPLFHAVALTITIDSEFKPVRVTSRETYEIAIPVLGAMTCTSSLTEEFYDIDDETQEIPEKEFFEAHIGDETSGGGAGAQLSPADYLASAFGDYLDGSKTLDLTADINIAGVKLDKIKLSVDVKTMNIRAKLGRLTVQYLDDRVYFALNDIKGYIPVSAFKDLLADPAIKSLLEGITLPDFDGLLGDDLLATVFAECEMTTENGLTCIRLPFELDGGIAVDASLYIADDGMELREITGEVTVFGKKIEINAKPVANLSFSKPDGSYKDMTAAIKFIPAAINTALGKTYGVCGNIRVNDISVGLDAYIDRENGLAVDGGITLFGQRLGIKYVNDALYAELGNIGVKATAEQLTALIKKLKPLINIDSSKLEMLKKLLPKTVDGWIDTVKSLELSDDALAVSLNISGIRVRLELIKSTDTLKAVNATVKFNLLGIKLDGEARLNLSSPAPYEVKPDGDYIDAEEIVDLVPVVLEYIKADSLTAKIDGSVSAGDVSAKLDLTLGIDKSENGKAISATGTLNVLGQALHVTYVDDTTYVALGAVKFKLDKTGVTAFKAKLTELLSDGTSSLPDINAVISALDIQKLISDALGEIKSVTVENGVVTAKIGGDNGAMLTADITDGTLDVKGAVFGVSLNCTATLEKSACGITAPTDAAAHVDVTELLPAIDATASIIKSRGATTTFDISYSDARVSATVKADFSAGLALSLSVPTLTYNGATASVELAIIGDKAYLSVDGSATFAVTATLDDANTLIAALDGVIPAEIKGLMTTVISAVQSRDIHALIGLIPAPEGGMDIPATLDAAVGLLKALTVTDGVMTVDLGIDGNAINITAATDLSRISAETTVNGTALGVAANIISGATVTIPDGDYITADKIVPLINAVLPLALEDGLTANFDVTALGATVSGTATVLMPTATRGLSASARFEIADVYLALAYLDGRIYIDLDNGLMLSCGTDKAEIDALVADLKPVLEKLMGNTPADGITEAIKRIAADPTALLNAKIRLGNAAGGIYLHIDATDAGLDLSATLTLGQADGKLNKVILDATAFGLDIDVSLTAETDGNGKLISLSAADGERIAANISVAAAQANEITINGKYVALSSLTRYASPVWNVVEPLLTAKTISLDLDALLRVADGEAHEIDGFVTIALMPEVAVQAEITMFKNTEYAERLYVTYAGNTVYISSGNVKLKFDVTTDIDRLYDFIAPKLPEYLRIELAKMLGKADGASAFSDISLLIARIKDIAEASSPEQVVSLLTSDLGGFKTASPLKSVLGMLSVKLTETGDVMFTVNVMDMGINVTPILTNTDAPELASVDINTTLNIGKNIYVGASVYGIAAADTITVIAVPSDSDDYVSLTEFTDVIDSAIGTFTARDKNGNITFELTDVDFSYNEKDTVDKNGKTVVGTKISVKTVDGKDHALRGEFAPVYKTDETGEPVLDENGKKIILKYEFSLEAHISLTMGETGGKTGALDLDLYVTRDKQACLYYYETGTGYGERVYIDYDSVMEIVAAVLDIVVGDDVTVKNSDIYKKVIAPYCRPIDTSLFASMDIKGLDKLQKMLVKLVQALDDVRTIAKEVSSTINKIKNADSVENLRDLLPELTTEFKDAVQKLKTVVNSFKSKTNSTAAAPKKSVAQLYKQIVNGVTFRKSIDESTGDNVVGADVNNNITVGTDGDASVDVSQKDGALTRIKISDLDVDTALVAGDIRFIAGKAFDSPIVIPEDMASPENTDIGFSDLSNIKHLLFDIMNSANLREFNIGGFDTTDSIDVKLDLSKMNAGDLLKHIASLDISIKYNIQVKIIDCDKNEHGKTIYKTAAMVELLYENCTASVLGVDCVAIPDCVTRLYFFDNVLYVQGVSDFSTQKDVAVGHSTSIYECTRSRKTYFSSNVRDRGDYKLSTTKLNYVNVMYTIDEFTDMLKSGNMKTFLNEFLFYLVPLSKDFTVFGVDLQKIIVDAISGSSASADTPDCTLAKVFKGYNYTDGKHSLTLGLGELTGNSALGNLDVAIVGKNDGDDDTVHNYLNNYISNLFVGTSIQNDMITINLNATLNNVVETTDNKIVSAGLSPTDAALMSNTFTFDGHGCGVNGIGFDPRVIYTLDGTLYKNDDKLYTAHGATYEKVSYSIKERSYIVNIVKHEDYKFGDTFGYENYTHTLTKAYELSLSPTYYVGVGNDDTEYIYTDDGTVELKSLTDVLLAAVTYDENGKIVSVQNRDDGIQWSRPWQSAA